MMGQCEMETDLIISSFKRYDVIGVAHLVAHEEREASSTDLVCP